MSTVKSFEITKQLVVEAYERVKINGGAAGIDGQTMAMFEENLKDNLYKLWNRMSSGSYFPPAVRYVEIPKSDGKVRTLGMARQQCWRYNWCVDLDIKGFFDNLDHELVMKAVRRHTDCKWILLYVERWLKAPGRQKDGILIERDKGTPQGGVISPLLANLFLHYAFD